MAPRAHRSVTPKFHQRRDTIVRAAVEVLNRKGVRGMTLADVAAKLDLVPTAVMYHFRKKEELAAACFHKAIEQYESIIAQAQRARSAQESLELFVRGYFEFRGRVATGDADEIAVYNDVRAVRDPGVGQAYTQMFRNARSLLLKSPEMASLARMDCNGRAHLLLAQLFWSVVWVPRYYVEDYPRLADHMLDILQHGMLRAACEWQPLALREVDPPLADGSSEARETFLQAATGLMNDHGYHGASVQKISERLNVTKGAFYHHLDTKDDLILACFERTLEIVRRAQHEGVRVARNGADNLIAVSAALCVGRAGGISALGKGTAPAHLGVDLGAGGNPRRADQGIRSRFRPLLAGVQRRHRRLFAASGGRRHRGTDDHCVDQRSRGGSQLGARISQQSIARVYARPLFDGLLST